MKTLGTVRHPGGKPARSSIPSALMAACASGAILLSGCRELHNLRQISTAQQQRIDELSEQLQQSQGALYKTQKDKKSEALSLRARIDELSSARPGQSEPPGEQEALLRDEVRALETQVEQERLAHGQEKRKWINETEAMRQAHEELLGKFPSTLQVEASLNDPFHATANTVGNDAAMQQAEARIQAQRETIERMESEKAEDRETIGELKSMVDSYRSRDRQRVEAAKTQSASLPASVAAQDRSQATARSPQSPFGPPTRPTSLPARPSGPKAPILEEFQSKPRTGGPEDASAADLALRRVIDDMRFVYADPLSKGQVLLDEKPDRATLVIWGDLIFAEGMEISPGIQSCLRAAGDIIRREPSGSALVEAYSNERESLSTTQAQSDRVAGFLIQQGGINPERLQAIGRADTAPRFAKTSPNASRNARIEITFLPQGPSDKP